MALFDHFSDEEIQSHFTHKGWFAGVCPVYVDMRPADCPSLATPNWVPELWLTICTEAFMLFAAVAHGLNPEYDPAFPIVLTAKIDGGEP
ncbi:MAG: hypothetical protein JNM76_14540 [Betaproteobacteria bacterium]|nr:hypothetical protein [Betaproteobacteria bacterium]